MSHQTGTQKIFTLPEPLQALRKKMEDQRKAQLKKITKSITGVAKEESRNVQKTLTDVKDELTKAHEQLKKYFDDEEECDDLKQHSDD